MSLALPVAESQVGLVANFKPVPLKSLLVPLPVVGDVPSNREDNAELTRLKELFKSNEFNPYVSPALTAVQFNCAWNIPLGQSALLGSLAGVVKHQQRI